MEPDEVLQARLDAEEQSSGPAAPEGAKPKAAKAGRRAGTKPPLKELPIELLPKVPAWVAPCSRGVPAAQLLVILQTGFTPVYVSESLFGHDSRALCLCL